MRGKTTRSLLTKSDISSIRKEVPVHVVKECAVGGGIHPFVLKVDTRGRLVFSLTSRLL
jgi:hypothetical protein